MVGDGDYAPPLTARLEHGRSASLLEPGPGTDARHPDLAKVVERVEERARTEVERVVVGQRDAVDAEIGERLGRGGRGPKVEGSRRPRRAPLGDAALEVQHAEVGCTGLLGDLRREQRGRRSR